MDKLYLRFSLHVFSLAESISVMKMLAGQAEKNVSIAIKEADDPGAVIEDEYEDEVYDQDGKSYLHLRKYYSCGSSVGYDYDEVKSEYKFLIAQLTRRSAYLTMFGLFEHRMSKCLEFMIDLAECREEIKGRGPIERAHTILTKSIGGKNIADVDHLTVIRNIMIHNDGVATNYNKILARNDKKTHAERRMLRAIDRAEGVWVNYFDGIVMDVNFLMYTVNEFNRYIQHLEAAVQTYHRERAGENGENVE